MKNIAITVTLLLLFNISWAQKGKITGYLKSDETPVEFANIALHGTTYGSYSNQNGFFEIKNIPQGTYTLVISSVGYRKYSTPLKLPTDSSSLHLGTISLQEDALGLNEVVVTGTMRETFITASPIKVEVITSRFIEKYIAPTNLMESISLLNGVQEVVACGVCFTNSISINGLPGPYTAVLMDGSPIYGNLASVYGLNGIPTQIIDRFEVIKGPSSTLYGSEAVAGVINIITKNPEDQPLFSFDIMGTSHLESFGNLGFSPKLEKASGFVGINYAYINDFDDRNKDGFSDIVNLDRFSAFTKWAVKRPGNKKFTVAGKYYYEDRRNGVEEFLEDRAYKNIRGSDSIYGESIYTNRAELFGTYEFATKESLKLDYSLSHHLQDSYYGADRYEARQSIAFGNFIWNKSLNKHDLLTGLTLRYQYYDDNTIATGDSIAGRFENKPDNQFIPGLFAQDEWQVHDKLSVLTGARLDYYQAHGFITSPRLNIKYDLSDWSTLRGNFGTGFKIVNLFAEDHAFVTGQRTVEIAEELKPERSFNAALNFNHVYTIDNSQGTIDTDIYYTYFTNKIIPNYDVAGKIIYENTKGYAVTKGISLTINHQFKAPFAFSLGGNIQSVTQSVNDDNNNKITTNVEFAPKWSGVATFNYDWKKPQLSIAYTLKVTGPMALPSVFDFTKAGLVFLESTQYKGDRVMQEIEKLEAEGHDLIIERPITSEPFFLQNIQLTKSFRNKNLSIYAGIQNLLNYVQDYSPLIGYNDPTAPVGFSDFFDTAYAYAPLHGRELYVGIRWSIK